MVGAAVAVVVLSVVVEGQELPSQSKFTMSRLGRCCGHSRHAVRVGATLPVQVNYSD